MIEEKFVEAIVGLIVGIVIAALISGAVLWLVSKLGLGLKVAGFGSAMIAGLLIGFFSNVIAVLITFGGPLGAIVNLVVAAAVIFGCGKLLKGLTVDGMGGALIAAIAIAAINYLIGMLASGVG